MYSKSVWVTITASFSNLYSISCWSPLIWSKYWAMTEFNCVLLQQTHSTAASPLWNAHSIPHTDRTVTLQYTPQRHCAASPTITSFPLQGKIEMERDKHSFMCKTGFRDSWDWCTSLKGSMNSEFTFRINVPGLILHDFLLLWLAYLAF